MEATCPIHWVLKLQVEVTVSTMEAEYISLSTTMCNLIPLQPLESKMKVLL